MQCPLGMYPGPPLQRIHVTWTAADLLNHKALYLYFWKIPTNLERNEKNQWPFTAQWSFTHSDFNWLLRGILPIHDYTIVIRQAGQPPGETPIPQERKQMARVLPNFPPNDQEMDLLEANIQGLIEATVDAFQSR